ncbi:hypothetical protein AAG570_002007 [Ranatra chinensis]|uniref:Protein regulator of cytokinesis 1 n=1 Tax=Ranatra chinensis TaxID=642074 RepID=A0ABD0YP47_9HEMI
MGDYGEEEFSEEMFIKEAASLTDNALSRLLKLWERMYEMTTELKRQRGIQFIQHLSEFYEDMYRCEMQKQKCLQEDIISKRKEISELGKELHLTIDTNSVSDEPTKVCISALNDIFKEYQGIKDKRMTRLKRLKQEENQLCEHLGEVCSIAITGVPSEEELELLDHRIFELQEEKVRRIEEYTQIKGCMAKLLNSLEMQPRSSIENEFLSGTHDTFKLSQKNMETIKESLHSLQEVYNENENRCMVLWSQVQDMWSRINEDEDRCTKFREKHKGISVSVMNAIKIELERCIELRRANLGTLIEVTKHKLEEAWDKMTYTEEQRQYFEPYFTKHCSEDILNLLELEVQKLRGHYENNIEIYRLAEKRQELWDRMIHLDQLAQDKNRLFNNRGGQLLKEERERKTIDVNLPKIDKQLQQHIEIYQNRYNTPFTWHGYDLLNKINSDWEEQNTLKKTKQLLRKAEHAKAIEMEARLGTQTSTKRKMVITPKGGDTVGGKQMKIGTGTDLQKPLSATTPNALDRTVVLAQGKRKKGRCAEPRTPLGTTPSQYGHLSSESLDSIASYTCFKDEIEEKSDAGNWATTSERRVLRDLCWGNTPGRSCPGSREDPMRTPKSTRKPAVRTPGGVTPTSRLITTPRSASKRVIATPRLLSAKSCFNLKL